MVLFLRRETDVFVAARRVLHFAPEAGLERQLRAAPLARYVTTDLQPSGVDVSADITALPFADESFDTIICSHVLEHIPDDASALAELRRVLVPGGHAFLQQPVEHAFPTFEDPSITDPEARLRAFGQDDHVRVYGNDFPERLAAAGFDARLVRYAEHLDDEATARFGIDDPGATLKADDIYVAERANAARAQSTKRL